MRKISTKFSMLFTFIALTLMAGCNDPDSNATTIEPSAKFVLESLVENTATITATTKLADQYAYLVSSDKDAPVPSAEDIFATGETGNIISDEMNIAIKDLDFATEYRIFICAHYTRDNESTPEIENPNNIQCSEVTEITDIKTKDLPIVEVVPTSETGTFSYKVNVPKGDTIGVRIMTYPDYQMFKGILGNSDAAMITTEPGTYDANYYTESTTVTVDKWYNGNDIQPREIIYLLAAESVIVRNPNNNSSIIYPKFDEDGYMTALQGESDFNEDDYWLTDLHLNICTEAALPSKLTAKVNVEQISVTDASCTFRFTPEDGVVSYKYAFMDDETYKMYLERFGLEGINYWSYFYGEPYKGATGITEATIKPIQLDVKYHLVVIAFGDDKGYAQSETYATFNAEKAKKPAPEVIVTPIENLDNPWEISFNVQVPTGDIKEIMLLCNKTSVWESILLDDGFSYSDVFAMAGNAEEDPSIIEAINSAEGYVVTYDSWEDTESRLVAMGMNDEGTYSNPDIVGSPSIADNVTPPFPDAPRVESDYFEDLQGDWTASVHLYGDYLDDYGNSIFFVEEEVSETPVKISNGFTYASQAPESLYIKYSDYSDEDIQAIYADFLESTEKFNTKLRGQNRLVCQGLNFSTISDISTYYYSPRDLLVDTEYAKHYTADDMYFEFGPKWFLEVGQQGELYVNINSEFITPLKSLDVEIEQFAMDVQGKTTTSAVSKFPATLSEDKNTITIEPVEFNGKTFNYATGYWWGGGLNIMTPTFIIADFKLIRNDSAAAANRVPAAFTPINRTSQSYDFEPITMPYAPKVKHHMTRLNSGNYHKITKVTVAPFTMETAK